MSFATRTGSSALLARLGAEKPAIVIELGTAYTRLGMAGEEAPRLIVPSPVCFKNA